MARLITAFLLVALVFTGVTISADIETDPSVAWRKPFNEAEMKALLFALDAANLTVKDMSFEKKYRMDPYRLEVVNKMLDEPLYNASLTDNTGRRMYKAAETPEQALQYMASLLDLPGAPPKVWRENIGNAVMLAQIKKSFTGLPPSSHEPIARMIWASGMIESSLRKALSPLTDEERGILLNVLPAWCGDADEGPGFAPEWAEAAKKADGNDVLKMAAKVDLDLIASAARFFTAVCDETAKALTKVPQEELLAFSNANRSPLKVLTSMGVLMVGGIYDDTYYEDATFHIDFGGHDTYRTRCASTVGPVSFADYNGRRSLSALLDLAGDDRYITPDAPGCASGVMGIGVLVDLAGDDFYKAGSISLAAGILGAGVLIDKSGDDTYYADTFAMGAGKFGMGLLADGNGNDTYRGAKFVQGFGFVKGVGALADDYGNDIYYAGGKYLHIPLLPTNYQSLSQGFGFGMRGLEASGGVGILADGFGNDVYTTEVYGQGSSYWFSAGLLVDGGGNDYYISTQYSVGTGIHLSAGALLDREGNDHYFCKNGVGIGGSHDWAVGLLMDLGGADHYQGAGAAQGTGHTNGVGILLDSGTDNDAYSGVETDLLQGGASEVRGTASIGVLIDMGGAGDTYSTGLKNGELRVRGVYGVALDLPDPMGPPK